MALVLETPFGFRPYTELANRLEAGTLELTALDLMGKAAREGKVLVSFYQDTDEPREIEAPEIDFTVAQSTVVVKGLGRSELLKEGEVVQVSVRNKGQKIPFFVARNQVR